MENENKFILIHVCGKDFRFLDFLREFGFKICKKRYYSMPIFPKRIQYGYQKAQNLMLTSNPLESLKYNFFEKKLSQ
jgi:hypothetical protein